MLHLANPIIRRVAKEGRLIHTCPGQKAFSVQVAVFALVQLLTCDRTGNAYGGLQIPNNRLVQRAKRGVKVNVEHKILNGTGWPCPKKAIFPFFVFFLNCDF